MSSSPFQFPGFDESPYRLHRANGNCNHAAMLAFIFSMIVLHPGFQQRRGKHRLGSIAMVNLQ